MTDTNHKYKLMQTDLLESNPSREELQALRNKRTGMTIFQISWIMAFVCLIVINWQLRYSYEEWPPIGVQKLGVVLPTIGTIALILSAILMRHGLKAIQNDQHHIFLQSLRFSLGLGVLFIAIMVYEWITVSIASQYGAIFRLMTGFHGIHALVIGAYLLNVYRQGINGAYNALDYWAVEAGAKLWYFVAFAWLLFYSVLYWI